MMGIGAVFVLIGWGLPKVPDRYFTESRDSQWEWSSNLTPTETKRWFAPIFLVIGLMLVPVSAVFLLVGLLK